MQAVCLPAASPLSGAGSPSTEQAPAREALVFKVKRLWFAPGNRLEVTLKALRAQCFFSLGSSQADLPQETLSLKVAGCQAAGQASAGGHRDARIGTVLPARP